MLFPLVKCSNKYTSTSKFTRFELCERITVVIKNMQKRYKLNIFFKFIFNYIASVVYVPDIASQRPRYRFPATTTSRPYVPHLTSPVPHLASPRPTSPNTRPSIPVPVTVPESPSHFFSTQIEVIY